MSRNENKIAKFGDERDRRKEKGLNKETNKTEREIWRNIGGSNKR
jgi:hypothetical protein